MKIKEILMDEDIQDHILRHEITREEIDISLHHGFPKFIRIRGKICMAITHLNRYLTIIFEHEDQNAKIRTAYQSFEWQIRRYNKK